MDRFAYDSLTPMERNCLRLVQHDRKTEHIAHALGIAPSTVNTHIFSARRKLGGGSRLTAGDKLRAFEALANQSDLGMAQSGAEASRRTAPGNDDPPQPVSRPSLWMVGEDDRTVVLPVHTEVREERATFVFDEITPMPGEQNRPAAPFQRLLMVLAIALLTAMVLISAPAIYDSTAQRIANSLERPHVR